MKVYSFALKPGELALLRRIAGEAQAVRPYRGSSAQSLYMAGYAEWDDKAGDGKYWLKITDEGVARLRSLSGEG